MRCRQCDFENMPGLDRCFKCGSVLTTVGEAIEIEPPRMRWWKKPGRDIMRLARRSGIIRPIVIPQWARGAVDDEYLGIYISIIPGLGHVIKKQWRDAMILVGIWIVLVLTAVFFFGMSAGMFFTGTAIALHAWMALSCSYMRVEKDILRRMMAMVVVCLILAVVYVFTWRLATNNYVTGFSAMDFGGQKVKTGDLVIGRRIERVKSKVQNGDLVLAGMNTLGRGDRRFFRGGQSISVGQVIGSGLDMVGIKNQRYYINGQVLDPNSYPVPSWLRNVDVSFNIPPGRYFVSSAYTISGRNVENIADYAQAVCIMDANDLAARVFMRWLPLSRRGLIKGLQ